MALTDLQRRVCRLLASRRTADGERYVAGGVALNELLSAPRLSNDIDLFHDTREALEASVVADRASLEAGGFGFEPVRTFEAFVEALVRDAGGQTVLVQWVRESAYRFFPLVEHPDLGLVLHPFDLATNKVLALVGRVEVRDWVDILTCHAQLQPLGFLAWAASGKDPGLSPPFILAEAARTAHYRTEELASLAFEGPPPAVDALVRTWRDALATGRALADALPAEHVGTCVLDGRGELFRGTAEDVTAALAEGRLRFHAGRIGGAFPTVR